jgi:hypothetical protein
MLPSQKARHAPDAFPHMRRLAPDSRNDENATLSIKRRFPSTPSIQKRSKTRILLMASSACSSPKTGLPPLRIVTSTGNGPPFDGLSRGARRADLARIPTRAAELASNSPPSQRPHQKHKAPKPPPTHTAFSHCERPPQAMHDPIILSC